MNIVPRDVYPPGTGYVRSQFTVGRSEPSTDEETWNAIQSLTDNATAGACAQSYNQTYVGHLEVTFKPAAFDLMGPLICQDDLTMYWKSQDFWERYFQALEKRNRKSIINRLANVFMQYVPKASCNSNFQFFAGDFATQPSPAAVDVTKLGVGNLPTSELTQEMLDATAVELAEEGADEPDSNGWITQGPDGPVFPLLIGQSISHRLLLNNSELRSDFNQSFQGWGEANPVIKRLGASRIIKNFRHVITRFPARWTTNTVVNGRVTANSNNGILTRVPTWLMSTAAADATKGQVAIVNPDWRDPALAQYEGVVVMSKWVMAEEILQPINSAPGMKWKPQNYFGEWQFVTGNDALLGIASCAGVVDPLHKYGRHFAQYKHALRPQFPAYGRLILFARCPGAFDLITCS